MELLIYGLATWRIASLFVNEAGPGDIFLHIRSWAGISHDENKKPAMIPDGFFPGILSCVWCCSIWAGAFWALLACFAPLLALPIASVFAFSTLAILIQERGVRA